MHEKQMKNKGFILIVLMIFSFFGALASDLEKLRKQAQDSKKQGKYQLAENIYKQILKEDTSKSDVIAYLQLLLRNQKYYDAKLFIEQDYVKKSKDKFVQIFIKSIQSLDEIQNYDSDILKLRYLKINSKSNDRLHTYYSNGFLFNRVKGLNDNYSKNFLFTNIDVDYQELKDFNFKDPQKREVASASYHYTSKTLYYEATYHKKKKLNFNGYDHSGIYMARQDVRSGNWIDFKDFIFNNIQFTIMQPCISKDGKRLYFVSDMPGGYGGLDIYYSELKNFTWSVPVNLGEHVNTPYDDVYPFVYEDKKLYFSTEGRAGLGGLDIFEFDLITANEAAENIGAPYNSSGDDFGLKKLPKTDYGFFNSNRKYINSTDENVYQFTVIKIPARFIPVRVIDSVKNQVVSNVKLTVYTDKTKDVSFYLLTAGFTSELKFEINEIYKITASVPGYDDISKTLKISKNQKELVLYINTNSEKNNSVLLGTNCNATGYFTSFINKEKLKDVKVLLIDLRDNKTVDSVMTDENGRYFFKNLVPNNVYSLSYSKYGYDPNGKYITTPSIDKIITDPHMGNIITNFIMYENGKIQIPVDNKINNVAIEKVEKVKEVEKVEKPKNVLPITEAIVEVKPPVTAPVVVPIKQPIIETKAIDIPLKIENRKITKVYFKRNTYQLNDVTLAVLNKYLEALNDNPNAIIVIVSHTDAFGDAEYNRKLSIRRANETANHFIKNGVDPKRIFAWGKGETQPLFVCDETVKCSPKQIQANRRTEIKIIYK